MSSAIAGITEGFSVAYLKELSITSLLVIIGAQRAEEQKIDDDVTEVSGTTHGETNGKVDGYEDILLWQVVSKHVKILRLEWKMLGKAQEKAETKEKGKLSPNKFATAAAAKTLLQALDR